MNGRLTKRDEFGNADIIGVDSEDLQLNLGFDKFNLVTDALNRLADFEENEEDYSAIKSACAAVDAENERLRGENTALHNICKRIQGCNCWEDVDKLSVVIEELLEEVQGNQSCFEVPRS